MGIDDVIAAALLSFIMLRRIEVRSQRAESFPLVPVAEFESWQKMVLSAYRLAALACVFKVILNVGWYWLARSFGIGPPYFNAVPALVFVAWVIALVSAWARTSDAKTKQERLGIVLRPSRKD